MENRKVYLDDHTNLLQLEEHMYPLVDVKTPNVFRNLFHYDEIPKIAFNDRIVPHCMPDEIWITDTTFRDGQQSRAPYSTEQIVTLYDYFIVWVVRRERSDSVNSSSIVKRTETPSTNAWKRIINSGDNKLDPCEQERFRTGERDRNERDWYSGKLFGLSYIL